MPKMSEKAKRARAERTAKVNAILENLPVGLRMLWASRAKMYARLAAVRKERRVLEAKDPEARIQARLKTFEAKLRKEMGPADSEALTEKLETKRIEEAEIQRAASVAEVTFAEAIKGHEEIVREVEDALRALDGETAD